MRSFPKPYFFSRKCRVGETALDRQRAGMAEEVGDGGEAAGGAGHDPLRVGLVRREEAHDQLPLARAGTISSPDTIANGTVPAPSMSTVGAEAPPGRISTPSPCLA